MTLATAFPIHRSMVKHGIKQETFDTICYLLCVEQALKAAPLRGRFKGWRPLRRYCPAMKFVPTSAARISFTSVTSCDSACCAMMLYAPLEEVGAVGVATPVKPIT